MKSKRQNKQQQKEKLTHKHREQPGGFYRGRGVEEWTK